MPPWYPRLLLYLQCALDLSPIPGRNQESGPPASASEGPSGPLKVGFLSCLGPMICPQQAVPIGPSDLK